MCVLYKKCQLLYMYINSSWQIKCKKYWTKHSHQNMNKTIEAGVQNKYFGLKLFVWPETQDYFYAICRFLSPTSVV